MAGEGSQLGPFHLTRHSPATACKNYKLGPPNIMYITQAPTRTSSFRVSSCTSKYSKEETKALYIAWLTSTYYYSQIYLLDPTRPFVGTEKATHRMTTDFLAGVHACLLACENFFDHFVQERLPEVSLVSISDWIHLLSGLVSTTRPAFFLLELPAYRMHRSSPSD